MGVPGKRPIPTPLKILRDEKNKDRINHREPKPKPQAPKCPSHLSAEAKKEWKRLAPELERIGCLKGPDMASFACYCESWATFVEAEKILRQSEVVVMTKQGNIIQNPLLGISNRAKQLVLKFASEFGMTPSSRTRIQIIEDGGLDAFEALLD